MAAQVAAALSRPLPFASSGPLLKQQMHAYQGAVGHGPTSGRGVGGAAKTGVATSHHWPLQSDSLNDSQKALAPRLNISLESARQQKRKSMAIRVANDTTGGGVGGTFRRGGGGDGGGGGGNGDGGGESDGSKQAGGGIAALWASYQEWLVNEPVKAKAITAALLNLLGDLHCQIFVERSKHVDIKRSSIIALLGLVLVGPSLHLWYQTLSKTVTATGTSGAIIRLFLDQFVFSPVFIAVFFSALLTLEGKPDIVIPKLKQDWASTTVANWKLWVPFQFVNFRLVPLHLQVAFANVVALAWNVYLSYASHKIIQPA